MTMTMADFNEHKSPTLSRNHLGWVDAIVKWTRGNSIELRMYPSNESGENMMQIYKGDLIQVSPKHRREDWCLVQVGHVMGWLNTNDVKFLMQGPSTAIERSSVHSQTKEVARVEAVATVNPFEEETKPPIMPPAPSPKRDMLQKLISFFKK